MNQFQYIALLLALLLVSACSSGNEKQAATPIVIRVAATPEVPASTNDDGAWIPHRRDFGGPSNVGETSPLELDNPESPSFELKDDLDGGESGVNVNLDAMSYGDIIVSETGEKYASSLTSSDALQTEDVVSNDTSASTPGPTQNADTCSVVDWTNWNEPEYWRCLAQGLGLEYYQENLCNLNPKFRERIQCYRAAAMERLRDTDEYVEALKEMMDLVESAESNTPDEIISKILQHQPTSVSPATPVPPTPISTSISIPHGDIGPGVYLISGNQRGEVQNTYALITRVLGGSPIKTPDCAHPEFGPHITEEWDDILGKNSFVFHIHVQPDNDRCLNFDRQRTEIKVYDKSSDYLKGFFGETVTYRWRFKLDGGFQPSKNFTHIHQIKAKGGDDDKPVVTLTPREGSPEVLEISMAYLDAGNYKSKVVATAPLSMFKGVWIEAYERIIWGEPSSYRIELRNLMSGDSFFTYENPKIDLWRHGVEFMRPKWGIYRSLKSQEYLRDEQVRFDHFCMAKGRHDCP